MKSVVDISRIKESMVIEQWPIEKPIPYARNARKLSPHAVDKVAASLQEFGWQQPLVVDSAGVLIVGHTRLMAAKKLGYAHVPVLVAHWLTAAQVKAYRLMDNRSHDESEWDWDLLGPEFEELTALNFDLTLTGFDAPEFTPDVVGLTDEDEVPEVPIAPVTQPGDLWILGDHRLMCGDSTSIDAVELLMDSEKADMVFTDPPYGVAFQSGMSKGGTATRFDVLANDDKTLDVAPIVASFLRHDGAAFIWTSHQVYPVWREQFDSLYKHTIIWHKPGGGIGDLHGSYATDYEMCLFCVNGRPEFRGKRGMAVWFVKKDGVMEYKHPTQKPVELAERAIVDFTDIGYSVLDLFGGSGSTMIAAEKLKRSCRMMELDPKYCDVIVARWQNFTGKEATLDGNGCTFAHAKEGRMLGAQDTIKDEICR